MNTSRGASLPTQMYGRGQASQNKLGTCLLKERWASSMPKPLPRTCPHWPHACRCQSVLLSRAHRRRGHCKPLPKRVCSESHMQPPTPPATSNVRGPEAKTMNYPTVHMARTLVNLFWAGAHGFGKDRRHNWHPSQGRSQPGFSKDF